jgi:hypothetical protein
MEGSARIWFKPHQRAELWERWKNGQCVADIARALERRNERCLSYPGAQWRHCSGAAPESCGSATA